MAIERLLDDFLQARLLAYETIRLEERCHPNGRVDLSIMYTDGVSDILELKWLGRSVSRSLVHATKEEIEDTVTLERWESPGTTIMPYRGCSDGLRQLFLYLTSNEYQRGCLAIFECLPEDRRKEVSEDELLAEIENVEVPPDWSLWVVEVTPCSPSSRR